MKYDNYNRYDDERGYSEYSTPRRTGRTHTRSSRMGSNNPLSTAFIVVIVIALVVWGFFDKDRVDSIKVNMRTNSIYFNSISALNGLHLSFDKKAHRSDSTLGYEENRKVVDYVERSLTRVIPGDEYRVVLTRNTDSYVSEKRMEMSELKFEIRDRSDIVISNGRLVIGFSKEFGRYEPAYTGIELIKRNNLKTSREFPYETFARNVYNERLSSVTLFYEKDDFVLEKITDEDNDYRLLFEYEF